MSVVAKISFPYNPAVAYVITYKKSVDSTWITPAGNPTHSSPFYIPGLDEDTQYDYRIETDCGIASAQFTTTGTVTYVWVPGDFICEQDSQSSLVATYTGFSSPIGIVWDQPSNRFYVIDSDDVLGNIWWFNPDTITGFSSANHIAGLASDVNTFVYDPINRRIIVAGDQTGGAYVFDIATNTFTTLTYGVNASPGTGRRTPVVLSDTYLYCFCNNPDVVRIYNRVTLAFVSEILKSTITSASTYLVNGYSVNFIGNEIWVGAASRTNGNIARYNNDFTSFLGTITLPGVVAPGSPWTAAARCWQAHFYDKDNDRYYVADIGSRNMYTINTITRTIVNTINVVNLRGKHFINVVYSKNALDTKIYASVRCVDDLTDPTPNSKLYRLDPPSGAIEYMFVDARATSLELRAGTSEQWGVNPGLVIWDTPNTGYNTDGLVLKYM